MLSITAILGMILIVFGLYLENNTLPLEKRFKKVSLGTLQVIGECMFAILVITIFGINANITTLIIAVGGTLLALYSFKYAKKA
jgi:hypothetical protein